jgi:GH24 family phage-related lysozyme (muramidase)
MAVPWGSLQAQRSRVLPQAPPNILGNLITQFDAGREVFNQNNSGDLALQAADAAERFRAGNAPNPGGSGAALGSLTNQPQPQQPRAPQPGEPGYNEADDPNITGWTPPLEFSGGVNAALTQLAGFEGFSATPYPDYTYRDGKQVLSGYRNGYGQDADPNAPAISEEEARRRLAIQVRDEYVPHIQTTIGADRFAGFTSDQQGALASIVHNYGSLPGRIIPALQSGDLNQIAQAIRGLAGDNNGINARRRNAEADFFAAAQQQDQTQQAVASLAAPAPNSAGAQATAAYRTGTSPTPFTPQERNLVRQLFANPFTRELGMQLIQQRYAQPEPGDPYTLSPGQTRFDGNNNAVANVPAAAPAPQQPTTNIQEYEYGVRTGFEGSFADWQTLSAATGGAPTDLQLYDFYSQQETAAGREPQSYNEWDLGRRGRLAGIQTTDDAMRAGLASADAERWGGYTTQGYKSSAVLNDLEILAELSAVAPGGLIPGTLAGMFPGFNTAADAFQSMVARIAPNLRAEGSGSTSDIEYAGMLRSLPQLVNSVEARGVIIGIMQAKSRLDLERAAVVQRFQNRQISAEQARGTLAEIDNRSIMTPEMRAVLGLPPEDTAMTLEERAAAAGPVPTNFEGTPEDWMWLTDEARLLWR